MVKIWVNLLKFGTLQKNKKQKQNKTKQNKIFKILKGLLAFTIKDQSQIAIMIWKNEIDMSPM